MSHGTPGNGNSPARWRQFRAGGGLVSVGIAAVFFAVTTAILMLRQDVIIYRAGEYVQHDITARVDFNYTDADEFDRLRMRARQDEPRVYRPAADYWVAFHDDLISLPDRTFGRQLGELSPQLRGVLHADDLQALAGYHGALRQQYAQAVQRYIDRLSQQLSAAGASLVILPADQRQEELNSVVPADENSARYVTLYPARRAGVATDTYPTGAQFPADVTAQLQKLAEPMPAALRQPVTQMAVAYLESHPTHELDLAATKLAQDRAADAVLPADAVEHYTHDTVIVPKGEISDRDWQLLRAENATYLAAEEGAWIKELCGTMLIVLSLTAVLAAYIKRYQPRIVRNPIRAIVLAALMASMLLVSGLAGSGSGPLYFYGFGIAPTILTAIILTIAYDQRFAIGVSAVQAALVTCALNQGIGFFLILLVGVLVSCFMLDDVRTRSKLIEVGGAAAIAMMVVSLAAGLTSLESMHYVIQNTLYAGAAGMAAGFVTLGILPFIERIFHITTSMTLLELADVNQPLLKRLALEAPGTYNHSLQVATLAEAAAEAIGANALVCRVGAYYHDVGKVNKADYFAENQTLDAPSRHMNLSPSVSLLIILGHVKDGMELARQHRLPTCILQFIQQHHGTTLVEFFYKEACRLTDPSGAGVSEMQYRYPGPKPKSRETAIMMLCDCVESACRAMPQPTGPRLESLVRDMAMRRLHDGQFDECDLTMRDLDLLQRAMLKTLLGIYHSRVAYPSVAADPASPQPPSSAPSRKLA
jgi:cyclic-di-AMP phosphodiesterase PgpH